MLAIDNKIDVVTDVATIALFDPVIIEKYKDEEPDWWIEYNDIKEVQQGQATLVSTGFDGSFCIRITTEGLTDTEKLYATHVLEDLAVEVVSGKLYCGDGADLSGVDDDKLMSQTLAMVNGEYSLTVYAINQNDDSDLPNVVVHISPRTQTYQSCNEEPRLEWHSTFLYRKAPKLKVGRKLKSRVWRTDRTDSKLIIKDDGAWPESHWDYDAILKDMSVIKKGDRIIIKTIGVDEENKLLIA